MAAQYAGQLVGTFINNLYSPVLYITSAIYSGWLDRTDTNGAAYTNTVLACTNPVSLDYISCRDVISKVGSPPPTWPDPSTQDNNTWLQLSGCNSQGIGTVDPAQIEVITYDFNHPTATRLYVERKIRDFKAGNATERESKSSEALLPYVSETRLVSAVRLLRRLRELLAGNALPRAEVAGEHSARKRAKTLPKHAHRSQAVPAAADLPPPPKPTEPDEAEFPVSLL